MRSGGGYNVTGDPMAFYKNMLPLAGWRIQHNWQIFEVADSVPWYNVYFESGITKMMYRWKIKTDRFAARIGKVDIRFVAIGPAEFPLRFTPVGPRYNYQDMKRKIAEEKENFSIRDKSRLLMI